MLPSNIGGKTTRTAGFFEASAEETARWLKGVHEAEDREAGDPEGSRRLVLPAWESVEDAIAELKPSRWPDVREAVIPLGSWSVFLNNTPSGTDPGLLPRGFARDLRRRAIRAVRIEAGEYLYPARILRIYDPGAAANGFCLRSITAMDDGGRWVFSTEGEPLEFEDTGDYKLRRKSDRFTGERLMEYLRALGVPIDQEPEWANTWMVIRT